MITVNYPCGGFVVYNEQSCSSKKCENKKCICCNDKIPIHTKIAQINELTFSKIDKKRCKYAYGLGD